MKVYRCHVQQVKELVGKEYAEGPEKIQGSSLFTGSILKHKGKDDFLLRDLKSILPNLRCLVLEDLKESLKPADVK